jgi:hypothetical protein
VRTHTGPSACESFRQRHRCAVEHTNATGEPLQQRHGHRFCTNDLEHRILQHALEQGCCPRQTDPKQLFQKRGKGSYVVSFYEGDYFRQPLSERIAAQQKTAADDPLYEPLRTLGVDGPAISRLLASHSRTLVQRWLRITDAALHEQPRGFAGFRVSPAAFLIDGVDNGRTPPDWFYAHEKRQERTQWERQQARAAQDERHLRTTYEQERKAAFSAYLRSADGRRHYDEAHAVLLDYYRVAEPLRFHEAAHEATLERLERVHFQFPDYPVWALHRSTGAGD